MSPQAHFPLKKGVHVFFDDEKNENPRKQDKNQDYPQFHPNLA